MQLALRMMLGLTICGATMAFGQDAPRPLPLKSVTIEDAFWSPKQTLWRTTTITDCFDKFEKSGAMANFDLIRDGNYAGKHNGEPWYDGLIYEMITASAGFLVSHPDAALQKRIDGFIDRIAAASATQKDGYLNTYTLAKEPTHRWGANGGNDRFQHDLYNGGCLVEAAVHYYRATGDTKLLKVAVKMANLMCDTMGPSPRQNIIPGHAIGELSFLQLYQLFQQQPALKEKLGLPIDEKRYLELAEFWIDARGHHEGRTDFGSYDQDHLPVAQQATIEGHAVRAVLLGTGMMAIGREANRPDYLPTAMRWWQNMVSRREYLTGGVGATAEDEKFGGDYFLPNNGYAETCAAVGRAFFDTQILQQTGNAAAADEYERSLYNGALTGVSVAGTSYFYENPLAAGPDRNRWTWHDCPCCPPMFLKLMSTMPSYIYATDASNLYVNLFIGSTAHAAIGSNDVTISQTTGYPWSGDVAIKIDPKQAGHFGLNVRVPSWCQPEPADALYKSDRPASADQFNVSVNGKPADYKIIKGYAHLDRDWQPGDTVAVRIDVAPRRVLANTAIEANRGRIALAAGPLVYCVESTDQKTPIDQLRLPSAGRLQVEYRPDLLGGVGVIRVTGTQADAKPTEITAIPFFATANRGPRTMEVWVLAAR